MPAVGQPNNPTGLNNFDGFAPEPAYGEGTKQAALKGGAPLAGAPMAAGAIAAPKRAGRKAKSGAPAIQPTPPVVPGATAPPADITYDARLAQYWMGIAAIPGASDLVKQYAAIAQQRLSPLTAAWGTPKGPGGKAGQGQKGLPPAA